MDASEKATPTAEELERLMRSPAWGPWPGEETCPKSREAFEDFYEMGTERSLDALLRGYHERQGQGEGVPCRSRLTLLRWKKRFNWEERILQRDIERRLGRAGSAGRITHDEITRQLNRNDDELQARKDADLELVERRLVEASPPAVPGLMRLKYELLGHPLDEGNNMDSIVGLPPGHAPLTFDENELLYRALCEAQTNTLRVIMQLREDRMHPKPLTLLEEEAPGA